MADFGLLKGLEGVVRELQPLSEENRLRVIKAALIILGQNISTLTTNQEEVLERIRDTGPVSVAALARATGRQATAAHNLVARLRDLGFVERVKEGWVVKCHS
jgi:DNA-binding MarR family transcriptional regulator